MVVYLWKRNHIYSQTALTWASLLSVAFSVVAAFGLVLATGVKFSGVVNFLAFLLLGLGVDDTFVIINAHRDTYNPVCPQHPSRCIFAYAMSCGKQSLTKYGTEMVLDLSIKEHM